MSKQLERAVMRSSRYWKFENFWLRVCVLRLFSFPRPVVGPQVSVTLTIHPFPK